MTIHAANGVLTLGEGCLLGLIFYGGLWWTVLKGVQWHGQSGKCPAWLFPASQIIRTSVVVAGFYFASAGSWQRVLTVFVGFLLGWVGVTRLTRMPGASQIFRPRTPHAP